MIFIELKDELSASEQAYWNIESMKTCQVEHYRKYYALSLTFPYKNEDKSELFKMMSKCDEFIKVEEKSDLSIPEATRN